MHLLPFCPYTSDDGFSVTDYLAVDPAVGGWEDIAELGQSFDLMFDLVLNHASQRHEWFQRYLQGDPQFADFFIDQDPSADLSEVVRPRSLPLLTEFDSVDGVKHIWTTFSADQVDLNYANPRVMLAMLRDAGRVRSPRCSHHSTRRDRLPVERSRHPLHPSTADPCGGPFDAPRVGSRVAPGTLILTETNVPHAENISYFGNGDDEAHMVYQFSLPPLLLDAIHHGDTSVLRDWLRTLKTPSDRTTFFNFTASHDGIGVRPLEGLVPAERVERLAEVVLRHGGRVSTRRKPDGSDSPYELNITYLDAVADASSTSPAEHSRRFLATQAIMLVDARNPGRLFSQPGRLAQRSSRSAASRAKTVGSIGTSIDRDELDAALSDPHSLQRRVFDGYRRLLEVRRSQPAFHPNAAQEVIELPGDGLLGFTRSTASGERLAVLANLSAEPRTVDGSLVDSELRYDELAQQRLWGDEPIAMRPFQVRWLTATPAIP